MPSMKCSECRKVAKCSALPQVNEDGRATLVYFCGPCKRAFLEDMAAAVDEGGEV